MVVEFDSILAFLESYISKHKHPRIEVFPKKVNVYVVRMHSHTIYVEIFVVDLYFLDPFPVCHL